MTPLEMLARALDREYVRGGNPENRGQFSKSGGGASIKEITLSRSEYGAVTHSINTLYYSRFAGKSSGAFYHGDYIYIFKILGYNEYVFCEKRLIGG